MQAPTSPSIHSLVERVGRLYSPPAVAMEVVRLTSEPKIDAAAICDCLAGDPALTAKLLRVVNSSVYGLKGKVADLTQAIALIGVRPLKLLVLGFSVPDDLLNRVEPKLLVSYWAQAVTRSIAAKEIAEQFGPTQEWKAIANEALVAGLLEGVGQLVLLTELEDAYPPLLQRIEDDRSGPSLGEIEQQALGFQYQDLSAALLRAWSLPDHLAAAIEHLSTGNASRSHEPLESVLELASLLTSLIVDRKIDALPALLERGEALCGLTRGDIDDLVQRIQPKADQLADALDLDIHRESDHAQLLAEAHAQLALVSEDAAELLLLGELETTDPDDIACGELLAEVSGLSSSLQKYLTSTAEAPTPSAEPAPQAHAARSTVRPPHRAASEAAAEQLANLVRKQIEDCRTERGPLALAMIELGGGDPQALVAFRQWWKSHNAETTMSAWVAVSNERIGVPMPLVDRRDAVKVWTEAVNAYSAFQGKLDVGIAGVAVPSKGFEPESLIDPAVRCLDAAISTGASCVKSIEVY